MRKLFCDCCKREIRETEKLFSMKITSGFSQEICIEDMCIDCCDRIKQVIAKAECWRKNSI